MISDAIKDILVDWQEIYRYMITELNITHDRASKILDSTLNYENIVSLTTNQAKDKNCAASDSVLNSYFCELPKDKLEGFVKKFVRNISPKPILKEVCK